MVTRRRFAGGLTSGARAGWIVSAGAVALAVAGGLRLATDHSAPVLRLRSAPLAAAPAVLSPAQPVRAPDSADHPTATATAVPATPAPPSHIATAPPAARAPAGAAAPPAPPAPLAVEPPALGSSVPAGTPLSPQTTFTITATGRTPVRIGTVRSTTPAFRILRDSCSGTLLAPGHMCDITVQLVSSTARGRHTGLLVLPVAGFRAATARLDGRVR